MARIGILEGSVLALHISAAAVSAGASNTFQPEKTSDELTNCQPPLFTVDLQRIDR
jgi:hypothetical protein